MPRWSDLRVIPAIDRHPTLVRFAQTLVGRAAVLGVYGGLLFVHGDARKWHLPLALVPPTFWPSHRRKFIALLSFAVVCSRPYNSFLDHFTYAERIGARSLRLLYLAATVVAFAASVGYLYLAGTRAGAVLLKRPIVTLLGLFIGAVIALSRLPLGDGLLRLLAWVFIAALSRNLWFLCYSLKDRSPRGPKALLVEVGLYNPVWWGSSEGPWVPLPKSGAHLARIEADSPEALAVSQLKGLKLTLWAMWLSFLHDALSSLAYGTPSFLSRYLAVPNLALPTFEVALERSAEGAPLPCHLNWMALGAHFFIAKMLVMAIAFHFAIGICRMAGFQALRGMFRPFEARSIADFWNRIHFYFKELMVEIFFYPTFVRVFKDRPGLRMLAATFAAAFFGNFLYHFLRDIETIAFQGFWVTLLKWRTYAFYSFLLALAIWLSQRRRRPASPDPAPWHARFTTAAVVISSFCLLGVFDDSRGVSVPDCGRFLLHLLPLASF